MAETQRAPLLFHDDSEKVSLVEEDAEAHRFETLQNEHRFPDTKVQDLLDIINSNGCDRDKWLEPVVARMLPQKDIVIKGDQTFDNWSVQFPVKDGEPLKDILVKAAQLQMDRYKPTLYDHLGLFHLDMLVRNVLQMTRVIVSEDWKEPVNDLERKLRVAGHEFCAARNRMEQDVATESRKRKRESLPPCQCCGAESNPNFTSHALMKGEVDAAYCSAACLQKQESIDASKRG